MLSGSGERSTVSSGRFLSADPTQDSRSRCGLFLGKPQVVSSEEVNRGIQVEYSRRRETSGFRGVLRQDDEPREVPVRFMIVECPLVLSLPLREVEDGLRWRVFRKLFECAEVVLTGR